MQNRVISFNPCVAILGLLAADIIRHMDLQMARPIMPGYQIDLAAIHDAGFSSLGIEAAQLLAAALRARGIAGGRVVDLGCGSGVASDVLTQEGFEVVGYDLSPAMIELARQRAPRASFHVGAILDVKFADCVGVLAVGEVVNYLFDPRAGLRQLGTLIRRVSRGLRPEGILLFDSAGPGRAPGGTYQGFREEGDWLCFHQTTEDRVRRLLHRRIITFMRSGKDYRRTDETHILRLYPPSAVMKLLRESGLRTRKLPGYGQTTFPPGITIFQAERPA